MDHVSAIGDPDVRDQYRSECPPSLRGSDRLPAQPWVPGRSGGRFVPPSRPASPGPSVGRIGLSPELGRAVLQGLVRFPALIGAHADSIAELPLGEGTLARLRSLLLEAAMTNAALDQQALDTRLAADGGAAVVEELGRKRGLGFSFTRRDAEPERACRDLALVIETLAARPGLDAALAAATARLKDEGDDAAFREQQRLLQARGEADTQLATLIEADGD